MKATSAQEANQFPNLPEHSTLALTATVYQENVQLVTTVHWEQLIPFHAQLAFTKTQ